MWRVLVKLGFRNHCFCDIRDIRVVGGETSVRIQIPTGTHIQHFASYYQQMSECVWSFS